MTYPMGTTALDKLRIQLIEADVEIGFGLIDDARAYRASGQPEFSSRALQHATRVVADIESRTKQLAGFAAEPFLPLVAELRYEIATAEEDNA